MRVAVISKDQPGMVAPMLSALRGHEVCLVQDRCDYGLVPCSTVRNDSGEGFLAGRMRDLGAAHFGYTGPLLFLDGDRVPMGALPDYSAFGYDAVCLLCEQDERPWAGTGPIPWVDFRNPHNYVYSCGIWLSQRAIDVARAACGGRIFHPAFDGAWGEEDRFLGDVLAATGLSIGYTDEPRLSGRVGGVPESLREEFANNFVRRIALRRLLHNEYFNKQRIQHG